MALHFWCAFWCVFQEYFDGDEVDHSSEPPSAKGLAVFRDPNAVNGIKRTATSINWHPDGPTKIAVSYRCALSCSAMQSHAIPCNTVQYHAIPCNTMLCHVMPYDVKQLDAIPCNMMQ